MSPTFGDPRLPQRFWDKVEPEPNTGCWLWAGSVKPQGYGCFEKNSYPHILTYSRLVRPVPDGLELDHLCRTPLCCNPSHLESVTHAENVRRGTSIVAGWAARTACRCGSQFVTAVRIRKMRTIPYRICVPCKKRKRREYRERTGK